MVNKAEKNCGLLGLGGESQVPFLATYPSEHADWHEDVDS